MTSPGTFLPSACNTLQTFLVGNSSAFLSPLKYSVP